VLKIKINAIIFFIFSLGYTFIETTPHRIEDLNQIYNQALQSSLQCKIGYYITQSEGMVKYTALGNLLPHINFSSSLRYMDQKTNGKHRNHKNYVASINLEQSLFNYCSYQIYKHSIESKLKAEKDLNVKKQYFIMKIVNSYFHVLYRQEKSYFAKVQLNVFSKTLKETQLKYKIGKINESKLKIAQAHYYHALSQFHISNSELLEAHAMLKKYTSSNYNALATLCNDIVYDGVYLESFNQCLENSYNNNYDLQSQIHKMKALKNELRGTYGKMIPQMNVEAGFSLNRHNNNSNKSFENMESGYIGMRVMWNILNGGSDYAARKKVFFNYQIAYFSTLEKQFGIKQQIEEHISKLSSSIKRIQSQGYWVIATGMEYQQYKNNIELGDMDFSSILEKLQLLYQYKLALTQAKHSYFSTILSLKLHAGTLSDEDVAYFNTLLR
jgi:outer membrane protein